MSNKSMQEIFMEGEMGEELPRDYVTDRPEWQANLPVREIAEIAFAREYAKNYRHGTTGHNQLMLISKMAGLIDWLDSELRQTQEELKKLEGGE
jgi:hypothetical protein